MIYTLKYKEQLIEAGNGIKDISKLDKSNIFITGANGLICSALIDLLMYYNQEYGYNIHVYAGSRNRKKSEQRFDYWKKNNNFTIVDYNAIEAFNSEIKYDYIIHGACSANPALYVSNPVEIMLSNITGIKNILDYARFNNSKRVLYISSSEVYGNLNNNKAFKENDYGFIDILDVRSSYSSSKRASETLCISYSNEYDIDTVIVRPGHIYGPTMLESDNKVSSLFAREVINNNDIIMKSDGSQIRSYCYIMDCISAILTVLILGEKGEAYNISNKNSIVTIKEMAEAFAFVKNKKVIFSIPSSEEKRAFNKMNNSSLNSDKLESLGWRGKYDIKLGAKSTIEILSNR